MTGRQINLRGLKLSPGERLIVRYRKHLTMADQVAERDRLEDELGMPVTVICGAAEVAKGKIPGAETTIRMAANFVVHTGKYGFEHMGKRSKCNLCSQPDPDDTSTWPFTDMGATDGGVTSFRAAAPIWVADRQFTIGEPVSINLTPDHTLDKIIASRGNGKRITVSDFLRKHEAGRPADPDGLDTPEGLAAFADRLLKPSPGEGPVTYRALDMATVYAASHDHPPKSDCPETCPVNKAVRGDISLSKKLWADYERDHVKRAPGHTHPKAQQCGIGCPGYGPHMLAGLRPSAPMITDTSHLEKLLARYRDNPPFTVKWAPGTKPEPVRGPGGSTDWSVIPGGDGDWDASSFVNAAIASGDHGVLDKVLNFNWGKHVKVTMKDLGRKEMHEPPYPSPALCAYCKLAIEWDKYAGRWHIGNCKEPVLTGQTWCPVTGDAGHKAKEPETSTCVWCRFETVKRSDGAWVVKIAPATWSAACSAHGGSQPHQDASQLDHRITALVAREREAAVAEAEADEEQRQDDLDAAYNKGRDDAISRVQDSPQDYVPMALERARRAGYEEGRKLGASTLAAARQEGRDSALNDVAADPLRFLPGTLAQAEHKGYERGHQAGHDHEKNSAGLREMHTIMASGAAGHIFIDLESAEAGDMEKVVKRMDPLRREQLRIITEQYPTPWHTPLDTTYCRRPACGLGHDPQSADSYNVRDGVEGPDL